MYSILVNEWPDVQRHLAARLTGHRAPAGPGAGGAVVLAIPGALIGGQFQKGGD